EACGPLPAFSRWARSDNDWPGRLGARWESSPGGRVRFDADCRPISESELQPQRRTMPSAARVPAQSGRAIGIRIADLRLKAARLSRLPNGLEWPRFLERNVPSRIYQAECEVESQQRQDDQQDRVHLECHGLSVDSGVEHE